MDLPEPAVSFVVWGEPKSKGSRSSFAVKKGPKGSQTFTGKTVSVEQDPGGRKKEWTRRVDEVVQAMAMSGAPLLEGPLVGAVEFWLTRPKSHPKTKRTWPGVYPDLSKLLRAIEDPLKGVLIKDDAQIVRYRELLKDYAVYSGDPRPRAVVKLWRVEDLYVEMEGGDREGAAGSAQESFPAVETGVGAGAAPGAP